MTSAAVATVRVPGTTANLGSGFDTLGLAVAFYNRAKVSRRADRRIDITSPIADTARAGALAMLEEAAEAFFKKTRRARCGIDIHLSGDVPIARGLGSSVTARLGCVAGLNALQGSPLDRQGLLELVAALEGHPDNAAPAVFGGFTAAGFVGDEVRCIRVPLPSRIRLVTLIPDFEVSTPEARKRVPQTFSKADTIHILNRASLVTAAFATGRLEALRGCFDDRIHQPYRAPLIPGHGCHPRRWREGRRRRRLAQRQRIHPDVPGDRPAGGRGHGPAAQDAQGRRPHPQARQLGPEGRPEGRPEGILKAA